MQELVELVGIDPQNSLLASDELLIHHVDRDLEGGARGALTDAGLQHPQLAPLDRELDVAHVAVVVLKRGEHAVELARDLGHHVVELGDRGGVADTGNHVFALGVDEEIAVELVGAVGGIARERDTRRAALTLVAEHHRLNVDGRAEVVGDAVEAAVVDRTPVHPRPEDGFDGKLELRLDVLRELDATAGRGGERRELLGGHVGRHDLLELAHQLLEVVGGQFVIALDPACLAHRGECVLEVVARNVEHDLGEHLHEAAVGIPRELLVAGLGDQALDRRVVHAEV